VPVFSKNSSGTPHFFCETCGAEVARNAKDCPQCGSLFASVLCPACNFAGEEALFRDGCPVCGYSSKPGRESGMKPVNFPVQRKPAGALPVWVYILTAAAFTGIIAALIFTIFT